MSSEHTYIGKAAIKELETNHKEYHEMLWASTTGNVIGDIQHGPKGTWNQEEDLAEGHTNWLVDTMSSLLASTESWCDFMSLAPPDGLFEKNIKESLATLARKSKDSGKKIVVRFMFGNILTVPVNCDAVIKRFTEGLPTDSKLEVWVGAWRKGMCWNHAKIIAVDGKQVHTGGHNLWDPVYLQKDPIHDTSILLQGDVAIQAHNFANKQWAFIQEKQSTIVGWVISKIGDDRWVPSRVRVTISEWPNRAATFAPAFNKESLPTQKDRSDDAAVPILSLGRYGKICGENARSSDYAFVAMFDAAQKSIRLLLQDVGPVNATVLGKKIIYKAWPKKLMRAWGRAMFERGVDVHIVLSNPGAGEERGNYSNGWSCEEVAAEIIKTMRDEFPGASNEEIKQKVVENLRVCYLKNKRGNTWEDENKVGLHSKFFIIDDMCTYVGSQNLYMFDLAEWGVAIDSEEMTGDILKTLWNPMWNCSQKDGSDCDPETVMKILDVNRGPNGKISDRKLASLEADIDLNKLKKSDMYDGESGTCGCVIS